MTINKKVLSAITLTLQIFILSGAEVLNNLNTNWSIVIPGKVVTEPAVTSYGFAVITDAKLLSAYSNSGRLLWEKTVGRYRDSKIFLMSDDFILLSTEKNSKISLLNPSGIVLWDKDLKFSMTSAPLNGWDGRFFIHGNNEIECIGITGLTKWKLNTEELSELPLQTLPDGSIVAFLSKPEEGKTKGIRISPFGEILEEIIFAGQVQTAGTHSLGITLTFTDGSAGFFSLEDNLSKNKWVLQNNGASGSGALLPAASRFLICTDTSKNELIYLQAFTGSVNVYKIKPENGQVLSSFTIKNIDSQNLLKTFYNKSGVFLCDQKYACFYGDTGLELWSAHLPPQKAKTEWNYLIYTQDSHFIICNTNWTLNAYRVSQATRKTGIQKQTNSYNSWYTIDTSDFEYIFRNKIESELVSDIRSAALIKGNYGKEEINYVSELLSACEVYKNELNSSAKTNRQGPSLFEIDSIGTEHILHQLTLYSSSTFTNYEAIFLQKITNKTLLISLLRSVCSFGYDPNGSVLASLEIVSKKINYKDEAIINCICDSVYSVCKFMGRPAFNSKGKEILQNFLFPNYSASTRDYARETLKKISALDL